MLKQKQYLLILLVTAVMLAAVVSAAWIQGDDLLAQVQFYDSVRGQSLELFYDGQADSHVLFLPPYVSAEDIRHTAPAGFALDFGVGKETLEGAALSENLEMSVYAPLHLRRYTLRLEQCAEIPSVFVQAEEGVLEYLHGDKDNTRDVVVSFLDAQGEQMLRSTATMYGRGNGSWESPSKKPYNLEFAREVSVGPFENITKLCLLADFSDESKLRNSLAYYAGKELGVDYASDYQYANLYVNGEYLGLYGLATKQTYQSRLEKDSIQAVFEIASSHNRVEFDSGLGWRIHVIHGSRTELLSLVETLETALVQGDWAQIESLIDVHSFAQKYALEEFLANLDLAYASQYFYLAEDGKIHCMLPWDYDWTLGSSYSYYNNLQAYELKKDRNEDFWYSLLLEHHQFREAAVSVWEREFDEEFLLKLEDHLKESIALIGPSWRCDKLRWSAEPAYNQFDLASGVEELEGFYGLFRDYFRERKAFLEDYYRSPEDYCHIWFYDARSCNLYVKKGTDLNAFLEDATVLDVQTPGERFLGWYIDEEDPLESAGSVTGDMAIRGYYEEIETEEKSIGNWWMEIGIVLVFGAAALGLLLWDQKRTRPGSKV